MVEPCWYALSVKSRHEKKVALILQIRGFESYLPSYWARRKWADRYKTIQLPLFPGYVFCRIAMEALSQVLAIPGIVDVVRSGNCPAPLSPDEINALKRVESSRLRAEPWPELTAGQDVTVVDGPLNGITGSLVEIKSQWRLLISISLLKRFVLVEIDRDWVVPRRAADSAPKGPADGTTPAYDCVTNGQRRC